MQPSSLRTVLHRLMQCMLAFRDPASFQEHPLTTSTLGLAWYLLSLHVFLTWLLDSPDACGERHSWQCGHMGKIHILSSKPSGSCTAGVAGLQPLEHQTGIGTQAQSAACGASALSLLLVSQLAVTPASCIPASSGTLLLYQAFPAHPMKLSHNPELE